jgi:prephenate dehydrogenase
MKNKDSDQIDFAVIGTGRFGHFWCRHLSKYYPTYAFDINLECKKKIERFANWASLEECLTKKYIFLTIPIHRINDFLKQNRQKFKKGSVLIDCASVKVPVLSWFQDNLPNDVFYIASHPLFGPDSARNKLRDNLIMIMPGKVPFKKYHTLVSFFEEDLGLNIYNLTADEHDELMAFNLNLVHFLGRALDDLGITKLPIMMSSLSKLNDIVKVVMNDTTELFLDFYKYNPYATQVKEQWLNSFKKINDQIGKGLK